MKIIKCYRFVTKGLKSKNGSIKWKIGVWNKHEGELSLCEKGFHACKSPLDSLNNIYGTRWFLTEARGRIKEDSDKFVASEMRLVKEIPLKRVSVLFSVACARKCYPYWKKEYPNDSRVLDAILAVEDWLRNPCKKTLRVCKKAGSAARSAWSATWSAAESAAGSAAESAESAESVGSAESAAWSAAESAAWSAWYAARSAKSAAWSAARSARSAGSAGSAWSAAKSAERRWQERELKRIIKKALKELPEKELKQS